MTDFELEAKYFDGSSDIAELTDYLITTDQETAPGTYQTPREKVIQAAKDMAVSWVQYGAQIEPIGRRFVREQFVRDAHGFMARTKEAGPEKIGIVDLAGTIAIKATSAETIVDQDVMMHDSTVTLMSQLLVDRFRAAGFVLPDPEADEGNIMSSHWRDWRRYGSKPV